jgi:molybdopterin/thiamine biosynthesis adenylyltransferase
MSRDFLPVDRILTAAAETAAVAMVGLGAIGSPTADAVARMPAVRRAAVIDPDRIEAKNIWSQHVVVTDVHHPKAATHRRRMRRINPDLVVQSWPRRVQSVPLGVLRGTIIVSAPDSRETRRWLAEAAWYVGAPLLDAGVEPTGSLVRVTLYVPGCDSACTACLFSESDYLELEQRYPCIGKAAASAPTNARFSLALTASGHQTNELDKLLAGEHQQLLSNRQLVIDCRHHRHFVTTLHRNPACRFPHDPPWSIVDLAQTPRELTFDQLVAAVGADVPSLRVPTTNFVTRLTCSVCGSQRSLLRLANRLRPAQQRCRACGGEMLAAAADVRAALESAELPSALRGQPLSDLGLERADIVAVGDGDRAHYVQLGRADDRPAQPEVPHG